MKLEIKKALSEYGLSDEETSVYLAVLSLGSATVREIAQATKIKRTTIYLIADKLVARGIMGEFKAKYGKHYIVSSPRQLINRLDTIKSSIEEILPQLRAIEKKEDSEPEVKFFKGKEGYIAILEDSLKGSPHEILYLGSQEDFTPLISEKYVTTKYIPARLKQHIKFRQLVFPDAISKKQAASDVAELRQTKFLPNNYAFSSNITIYKDTVAYFSSKRELVSVMINSKDIAEMERQKFNILWDSIR